MKEQLISFETAILARQKGFDWKTTNLFRVSYSSGKDIIHGEYNIFNSSIYKEVKNWNDITEEDFPQYSASRPEQSLLQKWLRDQHGICICIIGNWNFYYRILLKRPSNAIQSSCYNTYEESLEEGLKQALLLIP